ncbi:mandelate racemase/muconate lactonizing enzyme family protein [Micromonospora globbae]|uniref:Mandelate racemase/muconate lactonizing enzyme family protein n=1 Tax=Micromonospora globbae TaxID=1894969 RepID=A0A420ETN8_9ACTN|nr:mandelate racemase/muconate lactonizing enzyme family protein [Micromonospora globbae]RKF24048.1 mandelate racemase/muconate lactonizing enzyme family protein [Micromonospora globbae]
MAPTRITSVDCFVLKLSNDERYLGPTNEPANPTPPAGYAVRPPWRSIYSPRFETLLVRLTTDSGVSGWGEALAPVAPEVPAEVVRRLLAPALIGADPRHVRPIGVRLRDLMRERGHLGGHQADAIAAVDIALWDLAGRLAGLPVHELLGGAFREHVPTYVSGLPRPDDAQRAALAAEWAAKGVERIKLHLGKGVAADLATVDAVRAAAPQVRLAVDAHWTYDLAAATRLARGLTARGGIEFLEAPLAPEDLAGHADLARRTDLPVAVGEAMRHRYDVLPWLRQRAVGLVQPDVARTGITEAMAIAELAAAHHVPTAPHHSVALGVALAAGLHVSAAVEHLSCFEYQPTTTEVGQRILTAPLPGGPDGFAVPTGPGLGVEVDLATVSALAEER